MQRGSSLALRCVDPPQVEQRRRCPSMMLRVSCLGRLQIERVHANLLPRAEGPAVAASCGGAALQRGTAKGGAPNHLIAGPVVTKGASAKRIVDAPSLRRGQVEGMQRHIARKRPVLGPHGRAAYATLGTRLEHPGRQHAGDRPIKHPALACQPRVGVQPTADEAPAKWHRVLVPRHAGAAIKHGRVRQPVSNHREIKLP
mmetsp:Transcript_26057/g.60845  ORF Transcript_26057/g.60845 Transcript_26057/m.60845 type:complete len:200 (+) Transcript_26057:337-936(+)